MNEITIGTLSIGLALLFAIIGAVFYVRNDTGKASFWLLAAILACLLRVQ